MKQNLSYLQILLLKGIVHKRFVQFCMSKYCKKTRYFLRENGQNKVMIRDKQRPRSVTLVPSSTRTEL